MKIGFEAKRIFYNKTGLGNYSRDLVRILSKFYPENQYFLYNPKNSNKYLFKANEINVFEKNPISNFYKRFRNLWRQFGVVNDLKKDKIKIYHGLSGEIPFGLKRKNIKSVVTIHDLIFVRYPELYSFWDRKIHFYKFKKAAQQADLVIAISEQTKQDIIKYLKINPDKIKVIYQGCNDVFKKKYNDFEKNQLRKKYNLPEKFILNVGTIETRKNVLLAVKSIKNIDSQLVIVGKETKYATEVKQYIKENNLENKVVFLKSMPLKELAVLYQMCEIFVYPSIYEGFGIPIIEALFSKVPVITTAGGVFPEAGGPSSIYINPESEQELSNAIINLLENQDLRNEIIEKGYEFVQKFNDQAIAKNYFDVYEALV